MAGETWIINKTPNLTNLTQDVAFTSYWSMLGVDGHPFSKIIIQSTKIAYVDSNNNSDTVYNSSSGWAIKIGSEEPQRTITFDSSPTGELLTWLQANAVKQGPTISFKHRYQNSSLIGTETYKFRRYSVEKPVATPITMPTKGDKIIIEQKPYRVLKVNGTFAEVCGMYNTPERVRACSSDNVNNVYENSLLDKYLSETFITDFSSTMQNAVVSKKITQDYWYVTSMGTRIASGTTNWTNKTPSGSPQYKMFYYSQGAYQGNNTHYVIIGKNQSYSSSEFYRKCYSISIQDIVDYTEVTESMTYDNTKLNANKIMEMFGNSITDVTSGSYWQAWTRSAAAGTSNYLRCIEINGADTYNTTHISSQKANIFLSSVIFGLTIDLSKIGFSIS